MLVFSMCFLVAPEYLIFIFLLKIGDQKKYRISNLHDHVIVIALIICFIVSTG